MCNLPPKWMCSQCFLKNDEEWEAIRCYHFYGLDDLECGMPVLITRVKEKGDGTNIIKHREHRVS